MGSALLCSFCSGLLEPSSKKEAGRLFALEGEGPAISFLRHETLDGVAKSMAAFMAVALQKEGFSPDVLLGRRQNRALLRHLSRFLSVPSTESLRSSFLDKKVVVVDSYPRQESKIRAKEVLYVFFCG